jgi:hypothetical protein
MGRARSTHGDKRILVGNPGEKRSLERPRCRWEENITMNLREIG